MDVVILAFPGKEGTDEPRFWLPALFLDGELYLFDTRLGLAIAGPDGKPVATLRDVLGDEKLLRGMDMEIDQPQPRPYPVQADDLAGVVALLEGSPMYLSERMQLIESELPGKETLTLTAHPSALAARVASHPNVASVQLWRLPYERLRAIDKIDRETQQKAAAEFLAFTPPTSVLLQARVLHLMGSFDGDRGANALYQAARPPEADMKQYREKAPEQARAKVESEIAHLQAAKQSSSYWLGLVAFERGNYEAAIDYLLTRTLLAAPDGPWTAGARYNLARAYEALGQTDEAIRYYRADLSAQRHGNLLRALRLEARKKQSQAVKAAAG
jgi:tetratricopeptide (TPR) repeat protein